MKFFLINSTKRKTNFKEFCKIPLPPQPVITRWGTWLKTSFYYEKHFDIICDFIQTVDYKNNKTLNKLKELVQNKELKTQLSDLLKFEVITKSITEIQTQGLSVDKQLNIIKNLEKKLSTYSLCKLNKCISKNPDLKCFQINYPKCVTFAPLTTVDVERSFSILNNILADNRKGFTNDNLEKYVFVKYNNFL